MVTAYVRLANPIGRGRMGDVWSADHLAMNKKVAVKFVGAADNAEIDQEALERFRLEAHASAQIDSPHAVQIFDYGVMEGSVPYLVMEFLQGETLTARLERAPHGLATDQAAKVIAEVASALSVAHAHGIVHRDIKPDNIFIAQSRQGEVTKVLDFGIAKRSGPEQQRLTVRGVVMGSPEHMSPEQVADKDVDPQFDLWALAVVAYKCVVGAPPFTGSGVGQVFQSIINATYKPATQGRRDLPAALDGFFARAFELEPTRRFGSAGELASAFHVAAASRNRARVWLLLAATLVIAALIAVGVWLAIR